MKLLKKKAKKIPPKKGFRAEIEELATKDPEFYEFLKNEEKDIFENNSSDDEEMNVDVEDASLKASKIDDENIDENEVDSTKLVEEDSSAETDDVFEGEDQVVAESAEILKSGKTLQVNIRMDSGSGKKLIDADLLDFFETVLSDPLGHRQALSSTVKAIIKCFIACTARINGESEKKSLEYKISSDAVFDGIVKICFEKLSRCLMILMNPTEQKTPKIKTKKINGKIKKVARQPKQTNLTNFKNWHRYGSITKEYLTAIYTFLSEIENSKSIVSAINAILELVDIYLHYPKLLKMLIKLLADYWSRKDEDIRCVAFVTLSKIVRLDKKTFPSVYKTLYVSYISNTKLINADTLPLISFMQKSFTELTLLFPKTAYLHAFLYVRQFAIHLRNAVIAKRKDLIQTVYNWQFIQGLRVWVMIVCQGTRSLSKIDWYKELGYPLVEIITILRKIFISHKYFPLRLHCIEMLLQIQINCRVFIPNLSFCSELLTDLCEITMKKPASGKGVEKLVSLQELLRLSTIQLNDAGYRDLLANELHRIMLESANTLRPNIAYAEFVVPVEIRIKNFIKNSKNPEHKRLFKSLYKKIIK